MKPRNDQAKGTLRLRVTATAETILRSGHPWLFADSVHEQSRDGEPGELAVIYDRKNEFLAVGLFDPDSPICVRVLHAGKPRMIDAQWWQSRFERAITKRQQLFDVQTTGYRLINGESDGWPGLVLDRFDSTFVLKLYTAAWLPMLEQIIGLIQSGLDPRRIILRLSRNTQSVAQVRFGKRDADVLFGPDLKTSVIFLENNLRFEADVLRGQKTGFFLDQRENRLAVEALSGGRTVLNAFSFSGGFSLYAVRGGAKSVTDLDISAHALESAKRNFKLNESNPQIAQCHHESIQADAFDWLAENRQRTFDLIVLDPPSLAKRETERMGAIHAYGRLAESAIEHLSRGGILVACSCSAHVTTEEFFGAVRLAAGKSRRSFVELQTTHHAPDHPVTFKEANYLKAIYLQL